MQAHEARPSLPLSKRMMDTLSSFASLSTPTSHAVVVCSNVTSHLRVLFQLALNLLDLHRDLGITLLYPSTVSKTLKSEVALQPRNLLGRVSARLIEANININGKQGWLRDLDAYRGKLEEVVEDLLSGRGGTGLVPGLFLADVSSLLARLWLQVLISRSSLCANTRAMSSSDFMRIRTCLELEYSTQTPRSRWGIIGQPNYVGRRGSTHMI